MAQNDRDNFDDLNITKFYNTQFQYISTLNNCMQKKSRKVSWYLYSADLVRAIGHYLSFGYSD